MRAVIFYILSVFAVLMIAGTIFSYIYVLPGMADHAIKTSLQRAGFHAVQLPEPEYGRDYVLYKNIRLDAEGIDQIEELAAQYSLTGMLFQNAFKRVQVKQLYLTGSTSFTPDLQIRFEGWENADPLQIIESIPAKELNIKNANISLLTDDFGGVTFKTDLQAKRSADFIDLQFSITSDQRLISFVADGTGRIQNNLLTSEIEIERAKFDWQRKQIKASRMHGKGIYEFGNSGYKFSGDFQIGGMSLLGLAWQNVAATLEKNQNYMKLIAGGKSVGLQGLELGLDIEQVGEKEPALSGFVYFETMQDFLGYYASQDALSYSDEIFEKLQALQKLTIYMIAVPVNNANALGLALTMEHAESEASAKDNVLLDFSKPVQGYKVFGNLLNEETLKQFLPAEEQKQD